MGKSDATTAGLGIVPRNDHESMTEKKGSKALMDACVSSQLRSTPSSPPTSPSWRSLW
eukprot:jgi/Pico_ML_1/53267/g3839.t1